MPLGAHGGDVVDRPGTLLRTAVVTVAAALTVTLVPHDAYARPHDPGDAAITAAQQAKNKKAADVGRLTAMVAQADGDARRAQDKAELAVERYNKAVVDLGAATAKASTSRAARSTRPPRRCSTRTARPICCSGPTCSATRASGSSTRWASWTGPPSSGPTPSRRPGSCSPRRRRPPRGPRHSSWSPPARWP